MFTTSHAFKSKSNSSKRTQECARLLNEEMQVVFKNIKKVALHLLVRKKNFYSPLEYRNLLMKKFPFVSDSPGFYLCPKIPSNSLNTNVFSLSQHSKIESYGSQLRNLLMMKQNFSSNKWMKNI